MLQRMEVVMMKRGHDYGSYPQPCAYAAWVGLVGHSASPYRTPCIIRLGRFLVAQLVSRRKIQPTRHCTASASLRPQENGLGGRALQYR